MNRHSQFAAACLAVAVACAPIPHSSLSFVSNVCPEHPCGAYKPPSRLATCVGDACLVSAVSVPESLTIVVALPEDSLVAPSRSFATNYAEWLKTAKTISTKCPFGCVTLPPSIPVTGDYLVGPKTQTDLSWNLGGLSAVVPVQVTFRALVPVGPATADGGLPSAADALDVGLPIYPIEAQQYVSVAGPGQGPAVRFQTYLLPGTYERVMTPDSPFNAAYPPDVNTVKIPPSIGRYDDSQQLTPDKTQGIEPTVIVPAFDLMRVDGKLDGWTAYFRDATTHQVISPVRALSGSTTCDVLLPTSHHPAPVGDPDAGFLPDALTNAELVIAPPAGAAIPREILRQQGGKLAHAETYPTLAAAVTASVSVSWSDGVPVPADVSFEATAIYEAQPTDVVDPCRSDAGPTDAGVEASLPFVPNQGNFEYVAHATQQPDVQGAVSTYSIDVPRGIYRIIVRPHDASPAGPQRNGHRIVVADDVDTLVTGDLTVKLTVDLAPTVRGTATIADGRPMSGVIVDALPIQCPVPTVADGGFIPKDSAQCLPRAAQTSTDQDGGFSMPLDPGGYVLRVRPADGSRLPWVTRTLTVSGPRVLDVTIPAPAHQQVQLRDVVGNPIMRAIVRLFTAPTKTSPAIEVWNGITDTDGRFDVYLDPGVQ